MTLDLLLKNPSWLIIVAQKSGLADELKTPKTLQQLIEKGYDSRVVEAVCYALQHTTPAAIQFTEGGYLWTGKQSVSQLELFEFEMERRKYLLTETLRTGQPVGKMEPWFYDILSKDMIRTAKDLTTQLTSFIKENIPYGTQGIDVGGAHGIFSNELQKLGYIMTILDLPIAQTQAKKMAPEVPFISRNLLEGALNTKTQFDWALIVRFIRMHRPEGIKQAIKNLSYSLKNPSKLIIIDTFRDESDHAANITLKMMLNTPSGNTYTIDHLQDMLPNWILKQTIKLSSDLVATVWTRKHTQIT